MILKVVNLQTQVEITELDLDEILVADEDICLVGRAANAGLVLDSPDISRLHGKFFRQNGEIYYADLGSRNGTKVNDEIIVVNQSYLLKPGDIIQASEFVLIIQETSDIREDVTVVRGVDTTTISSWRFNAEVKPTETQVITETSGALVRVTTPSMEADDPKSQTKALLVAINKRVLAELKAAGKLTRDAYIKAVRNARETVEHNKLIDQEELEKEAQKYWQSLAKGTSALGSRLGSAAAKGVSGLGSRLGSAAKAALGAAWKEMTAAKSDFKSGPKHFRSTHSDNELSHLSSENQVKEDKLPED